jgi:hypothetical protein
VARRHQSPIIPVRVGPQAEVFPVHKDILTRSEYFKKALDGEFREAGDQAIDLPEEDPAIFSFVVAFLYEGNYSPLKPIATVLGRESPLRYQVITNIPFIVAEPDKGKGRELNNDANSGSEDGTDSGENASDDR